MLFCTTPLKKLRCLKGSVLSPMKARLVFCLHTFLADHCPPLLLDNALISSVSQSPACAALLKGFSSRVKEISQQEAPRFMGETRTFTYTPWKCRCWCSVRMHRSVSDTEDFIPSTAYHRNPFVPSNTPVYMDLIWYVLLPFCLDAELNSRSSLREWKQPKSFQPDITAAVVARG